MRSPIKPMPSRSPPSTSPEKSSPPPPMDTSMAIVTFDNFATQFSSSPSPPHSLDHSSAESEEEEKKHRGSKNQAVETPSPMVVVHSLPAKELAPPPPPPVTTTARKTPRVLGSGKHGGQRRSGAVSAILRRSKTEKVVKFSALGFRVSEIILSLISFSIMAADKTQGWSGDSFDRYKEYRFCLSVNVVAFVYSGFQACDLAYHLVKEKHLISHHLRPLFEFIMDQVLAYLLISASTAAVTRVDDWVSNWGKDEFTEMASASVAMSFLAFLAFAFSSLISGYSLFNQDSF